MTKLARKVGFGIAAAGVWLSLWAGCSGSRESENGEGGARPTESAAVVARGGIVPVERDGELAVDTATLRIMAPMQGDGALRIAQRERPERWFSVTAMGRAAAGAEVSDGMITYRDAEPDTDVIVAMSADGVEEHRVLKGPAASTNASYALDMAPGLAARERHGRIEIIDGRGRVVAHTKHGVAVDADGTTRAVDLALEGEVVHASIDANNLKYPIAIDPMWVYGPHWPNIGTLALNSAWVKEDASITSDVAVLDVAPGEILADSAELVVGVNASVSGDATANRIRLRSGAHLQGSAHFNALVNNGTISGGTDSPLPLPLSFNVPDVPSFEPGSDDVTLVPHESRTLSPGDYGDIVLKQGSTGSPTVLTLSGGIYEVASVDVREWTRIECQTACEVRIAERLLPGGHSFIGPAAGSGLTAGDVELFVMGQNGGSDPDATPRAAAIGHDSGLEARIFAPNGTVRIGQGTSAKGTVIGRDVIIGVGATFVHVPDAAGSPDCSDFCAIQVSAGCSAGPSDQAECTAACEEALDARFCSEHMEALVTCVTSEGSATCDGDGLPTTAGCETEQDERDACDELCAGVEDSEACTDDFCDCTPSGCDPATAISHAPLANGSACDDGSACTSGDSCGNGACTGTAVICTAADACHSAGVCDPASGICSNPANADGSPCDDGTACTASDGCVSGSCVGASPVTCTAPDDCHDAGTCDPSTGTCSHPEKAHGTPCSDSNACTQSDACASGSCVGSSPVACTALGPCYDAGSCDPASGVCSNPPKAQGTTCADANVCNGEERCDGAGTCAPGTPLTLSDDNPCTIDACDPLGGVTHTAASAGTSCSNGDVCDGDEVCDGMGSCQQGTPLALDDGSPCTADLCDPVDGASHPPEALGTSCADSDECNGEEACDGFGSCAAQPPAIDDADPGTIDICWPTVGIVHHESSPIDRTVGTTLFDSMTFLFEGDNPAQLGVAPGTIDPQRIAMLRGRVLDTAGAPLPGVTIRILAVDPNTPDYGVTLSQGNGTYLMAANGGGPLTVTYEKEGYPMVQRTLESQWAEWAQAPDVVLTPYDTAVTSIDLTGGATSMQIHRATRSDDSFTSRQATVLFNAGTSGVMVMPNGTTQPAGNVHFRVTEFTRGDVGPSAMPGELPATSQYTYCVELGADEEVANGAVSIEFSQPVIFYLENVLGFSVRARLPVGMYDRATAKWIPEEDGIVLAIVGESGGKAELDLDGDAIPEGFATFNAVGITDDERAALADLYEPGTSLWRIVRTHATNPIDLNPGMARLAGECVPDKDEGCELGDPESADDKDCSMTADGSIIECHNQILGEAIPVAGTPFTLHYQSDRVSGRRANYELTIPIIPDTGLPEPVIHVLVEVRVAGQVFGPYEFECGEDPMCAPGSRFHFTDWDGTDALGRELQGPQPAEVRIGYSYIRTWGGYSYVGVTGGTNGGGGDSFGGSTALPPSFGAWPAGTPTDVIDGAAYANGGGWTEFVAWSDPFLTSLGSWSSLPFGLGGLSLSEHHGYNPRTQTLYFGDGTRRAAANEQNDIVTVAGGADDCTNADDIPAADACLVAPRQLDIAPDGSIYFFTNGHRIRRIGPDGIIHTIAGLPGAGGYNGDNIPAVTARLNNPRDLALGPDGSLYIADTGNQRIRRIGPDGIITTVAGTGTLGFTGDGGPATAARINGPAAIDVGPDGVVYFLDRLNRRIRAIFADGHIATVTGGGSVRWPPPCPPPECATCTCPDPPGPPPVPWIDSLAIGVGASDIEVADNGDIYLADDDSSSRYVLRIPPSGPIQKVAGRTGRIDFEVGGITPEALALGGDNSVYIVTDVTDNPRRQGIQRVRSGFSPRTVIGGRKLGCNDGVYCGEGGPAAAAHLANPEGLAVGPDGGVYIVDNNADRILRVLPALPKTPLGDFVLPSADGSELYHFDASGRHLETRDALLGTTLYSFEYLGGRLRRITDADGRTTNIVRFGSDPAAIVGPFGHQTTLTVNAEHYIDSITNPLSETVYLTYQPRGLLDTFTDPRGHFASYTFDADGQLTLAERPETGAAQAFARELHPLGNGRTIHHQTAQGRVTHYDILEEDDGSELWTTEGPDSVSTETHFGIDAINVTTLADGTVVTLQQLPDPRYGMLAPIPSVTLETGGHTLVTTSTRDVTLSDPFDPTSVESLTDKVTVNGKTFTTAFDKTGIIPVVTTTTHAGRVSFTELDDTGRPTHTEVLGGPVALAPTEMVYDDGSAINNHKGFLRSVIQGIGSSQRRYDFFYDIEGNLTRIEGPLGKTVQFTYDAVGRVLSKTFPDLEEVHFGYDDAGNLERLIQPGAPTPPTTDTIHTFDSDARDRLSAYSAPDIGLASHTTFFTYSPDGDVELVTRSDALTVNPTYDGAGRLSELATPDGTIDYSYFVDGDPSPGKLAAITDNIDGVTLDFTYEGSLPADLSWSGAVQGSLNLEYDDDLRVVSDTVSGHTVAYTYDDADGLLTQAGDLDLHLDPDTALLTGTTLDTVHDAITYNEFAEPIAYVASASATSLYEMALSHDPLGRITHKTETTAGVTTGHEYHYDDAGRLEEVLDGPGDCLLITCTLAESYTYDANGNRLTVTNNLGTTSATYDAQDRLLTRGATTYSYTAAGELLEKTEPTGTTHYTYDVLGNIRHVAFQTGTTIDYVIDGLNRRIGKKIDGALTQAFLYGGAPGPIAELAPDGTTLEARFVYATRGHVPDYMVKGGHTYRFVTDHLGSVRLVVDAADGSIGQRIEYDAWGRAALITGTWDFQPFGFAGGLYDPDTHLVRFGARDYDAESGRWTGKDPVRFHGGSTNLFAYAASNPTTLIDPSGLAPSQEDLIGFLDWFPGLGNVGRGISLRRDAPLEASHGRARAAECMAAAGAIGIELGAVAVAAAALTMAPRAAASASSYVYRLVNEEGAPVYYGISNNPAVRLGQHARMPPGPFSGMQVISEALPLPQAQALETSLIQQAGAEGAYIYNIATSSISPSAPVSVPPTVFPSHTMLNPKLYPWR